MLFIVLCTDKPASAALRAATRPTHIEYLEKFRPKILISGPFLSDDGTTPKGSLLILDFADKAEAQNFADNDPYTRAGLFSSVMIAPYKKVFGPT